MKKILFILATTALCFWATVPYGTISLWNQALLGFLLLAGSAFGLWLMRSEARWLNLARGDFRLPLTCIALLLGWGVVQILPMPVALLRFFQPGSAEVYSLLFPDGGFTSLSLDPLLTFQQLLFWTALIFWALGVAGSVDSRKMIVWVAGAIMLAGTLQALAGFMSFMGHDWFEPARNWRMRGTFYGPNAFGGFLAVSLPLSYAYMCSMHYRIVHRHKTIIRAAASGSRSTRWQIVGLAVGLASFLMQVAALIMSASRGAILASLMVALFFVGWTLYEKPYKKRKAYFGRLLLLGGILLLLFSGGIFELALNRVEEVLESGSSVTLRLRFFIWMDALKVLWAHPLGVGLGAFGLASNRFQQAGWQDIQYDFVHCDYLQWATEWGVIGVVPMLLLLLWLFRWSLLVWKPLRRDSSLWIQRGAALSVYAGLLHALVDYNLSSRPGVSVTFYASVGLLLASGLYQGEKEGGDSSRPTFQPRRLASGTLLLLLLFALIAVAPWSRRLVADITHEKGWISTMRFRSPLFWLKVQYPEEEEGLAYLKKAHALHPNDNRFSLDIGRVIMHPVEVEYNDARATFQHEHPQHDQAWFRQIARDALVSTRQKKLREAIPYIRESIVAKPWQGFSHAYLGVYLMEFLEASKKKNVEETSEWREALEALAKAEKLGTHLTRIHSRLCRAYSAAYRISGDEHWRKEALRVGYNALKSTTFYQTQLLEHFQDMSVKVHEMSDMAELPPSFVQKMYASSSLRELEGDSFALLDLMHLAATRLPLPYRRQLDEERLEESRQNAFDFILRERARWNLRAGRWDAYVAMREKLEQVAERRVARSLEDLTTSSNALAIKLRDLRRITGLPAYYSLLWADLEASRGHHKVYDDTMAELAVFDEFTPYWPGEFEAVYMGDTASHPNVGLRLCQARAAFRVEDFLAGEKILRDEVVDVFPSIFRYKHRVHWLRAQYETFRFKESKAAFHLLEGLADCPTDITLLDGAINAGLGEEKIDLGSDEHCNIYEMMDRTQATLPMGVQFFHGGMELLGMDLVKSTEMSGKITCRLYCRFWKIIPGNLHAQFKVHHYSRSSSYSVQVSFEEVFPVMFGFGRPQVGAVGVVEAELPMHRMEGQNLSVVFYQKDTGHVVQTDDGSEAVEILDWGKYVRLPEDVQSRE